jgi:transcriptional regulator with XRE-family HTH domain
MDADEARTIGRRVRQIRKARRKSLRVVAGLAGMSKSQLDRIERGEVALDRISQVVALANALEIAPSELTRLPVPAPANGHTDSTTEAVRLALDAIDIGRPGGLALPVAVLRDQVVQILRQRRACQFADVATDLPGLIRNLHTTLATGVDHGELLDLAVRLHVHVTRLWLVHAGAPDDLIRRVVFLARYLAHERDEVTTLAVAGFCVADALLLGGSFELGRAALDSLTLPPTTAETAGLVGSVAATHALAAVLSGRPGEVTSPMDAAAEVAERFGATGQTDSLGFVYGPANAGGDRMWLALEADDPDHAVSVARNVDPERHPFPVNRAYYWVHYGRALARLARHRDAVMALRTAEGIFPTAVRRNSGVREVLTELLARSRRDAVGHELRGMAYRAGLPV